MDMTTITAAYNGLKMVKDLFTAYTDHKIETGSQEKMNDAVKKVGEAQDALFQMRDELFRLQQENNQLKNIVNRNDELKKRLENYELVETSGGAVVYESREGTNHFICPSCLEKKEIHILQDRRAASGDYDCRGCGKSFPVKPINIPDPIKTSKDWNVFE